MSRACPLSDLVVDIQRLASPRLASGLTPSSLYYVFGSLLNPFFTLWLSVSAERYIHAMSASCNALFEPVTQLRTFETVLPEVAKSKEESAGI